VPNMHVGCTPNDAPGRTFAHLITCLVQNREDGHCRIDLGERLPTEISTCGSLASGALIEAITPWPSGQKAISTMLESHSNLVGSGPVSHEEISNAARVNATARMPPQ